nr:hypothetical protein [Tanacetum cinerariifolium]
RQKAKVEWLRAGDRNSSYFHNVVKGDQFVNHFKNVLGQSLEVLPFSNPDSLFMKKLPTVEALKLFFKDSWSVVGDDVCKAVRDFFSNGKLLKEINATITSLVPKVAAPSKVSNYRPIACCNVVYKIISKVICNRLKGVLGFLVDDNQSAFIPSRQISNNIMLSQELMRNYHRNRGLAKCAFKIDIEKAYDYVEWVFLSSSLKHFGFPELMVKWIMNYITTTSFTVNVNGDHTGFFKGMRGLRQGDPLSPYLFTLIMEVFNLVLRREINKNSAFRYHWQCKELKLTHLCLANDLLLFYNGDSCSVAILNNAISTFGGLSGLLPNFTKSMVFFGNVREVSRLRILDIMPFRVGSLPVRYLGVPLIPKRLYVKDCHLVFKRGKACVNWNSVCKPKVEGGLGIKSLDSWNKALMSKHIWNIITQKESLWVRIGDGKNTSLWFDNWHAICPLCDFISKRKIFASSLSLGCKVADVIRNGAWEWPGSISNSFDALSVIPPPVLVHDKFDVVRWKSRNGNLCDFSVSTVWDDIRRYGALVPWAKIVWFSQ